METLLVTFPRPYVAQVTLNRPAKRNAVSLKMYDEFQQVFAELDKNPDVRAIVLTGNEIAFTAGMDLNSFQVIDAPNDDFARRALYLIPKIKHFQNSVTCIESCSKPVIAAVSGYCIGAGVDIITAADIRLCTRSATISVREVAIGMAADIGTLQRLPRVVGNQSWVRELVYTGRNASAQEATQHGLFSQIFENYDGLIKAALDMAEDIGKRSPVAVQGSKKNILYSRDHTVEDGLKFMTVWNSWALQSSDFIGAITATMQKTEPKFPKL
jgi:Delta3,5-Delta2,4-dienoyl-CoA isomerase